MSIDLKPSPSRVHTLPGRVRIRLPELTAAQVRSIEVSLATVPSIKSVRGSALTENVIVEFDPSRIDEENVFNRVIKALSSSKPFEGAVEDPRQRKMPDVILEKKQNVGRARISVRGLDRNPTLARQVVKHLHRRPGVEARANVLTGRVLIQFDERFVDLQDLISDVADVELPSVPDEDEPAHPLDPYPVVLTSTRVAASYAGLGVLGVRQLAGITSPIASAGILSYLSGIFSLAQGLGPVRRLMNRLLGEQNARLAMSLPDIALNTVAGSPLGLAVTAVSSTEVLKECTSRRRAWKRYESQLRGPDAGSDTVLRLESGDRVPMRAKVVEGQGAVIGHGGAPVAFSPGSMLPSGGTIHCRTSVVVELQDYEAFETKPRPAPIRSTLYDRYNELQPPISLGYAALFGIVTRSFANSFIGLLLMNPRAAVIGKHLADTEASSRVLRGGVTIVGTRPDRKIDLPDSLLVSSARVLADGLEISGVLPLGAAQPDEILALASSLAHASGLVWGRAFRSATTGPVIDTVVDGTTISGQLGGENLMLAPDDDSSEGLAFRNRGERVLLLSIKRSTQWLPLGLVSLRPRLNPSATQLVEACRRRKVKLAVFTRTDDETLSMEVARRAGVSYIEGHDVLRRTTVMRRQQAEGLRVAYLSDSADAAEEFDACDLAIGLSPARSGRFPARADLLAPDLTAVCDILEAGARKDQCIRDATFLSIAANVVGCLVGFGGALGIVEASRAMYVAALASMGNAMLRMRGGDRPRSELQRVADPRPEAWGRRSVDDIYATFQTSEEGLTREEAERRTTSIVRAAGGPKAAARLCGEIANQARSPMIMVLSAGAVLSLIMGAPLDFALIAITIAANVGFAVWQEHQAGQAARALASLAPMSARVLRDGILLHVSAQRVVPGDLLLLAPGDRVPADARLIEANALEVDESSLTGESLPVPKSPDSRLDSGRIVLEGSDVTVGTGRAIVVAVGVDSRMGAIAAALEGEGTSPSALGVRLSRILRQFLPVALGGSAVVVIAGIARGAPLVSQLALGGTLALAAAPEGLPLLAGIGEVAVARRLAARNALVRRLTAVEALGRVDVACTDKTGTLTEGQLALTLLASLSSQFVFDGQNGAPPEELLELLAAAALASPHPDAADVLAHPTDGSVVTRAMACGLADRIKVSRTEEVPFDPIRAFHSALVEGKLFVKGAPEALLPRCAYVRSDGGYRSIDERRERELLAFGESLAQRGLRVLMVAEGTSESSTFDPENLVCLGFVGISDPLRAGVADSVARCRAAGIRVIMLTGDHPVTARTIAEEAGILHADLEVVTGPQLAELHNGELDRRLEHVAVVARVTPLDKLRIIESLQRLGHTVAMTGDGVNDAPALRLADVGVAMGKGGTEVARQASDLLLVDDNFSTLVEALVEGRSFWRNVRRSLGLLLGGNVGELGLVMGTAAIGLPSPLLAQHILAMNLLTDGLPALAVVLQEPEHRRLNELSREGSASLEKPLRRDVLRRGFATFIPSISAYLLMLPHGLVMARTVAFGTAVGAQLAQTLHLGQSEGGLTKAVLATGGLSAGLLVAAVQVPWLSSLLVLTAPSLLGWSIILGGSISAVLLSKAATLTPVRALPRPRGSALPARIL